MSETSLMLGSVFGMDMSSGCDSLASIKEQAEKDKGLESVVSSDFPWPLKQLPYMLIPSGV